jgi:hypothetical protein
MIKDRVMNFISLWEQLINCTPGPTEEDLTYILENVEPLRELAAKQLLTQKLNDSDLCSIFYHVYVGDESLQERVWQIFLDRYPCDDNLKELTEWLDDYIDYEQEI